ncbi:MAG: futalosine hydrolase, partial [Nitrospiraceae bacterium]
CFFKSIDGKIINMQPSSIGLISATQAEAGIILRNLKKTGAENFYKGKIGNCDVVLVISGIGKANAARAVTLLVEKFSPSLVINFGIGGAYPSAKLKTGDIAIADKEIYGDEGLLLKDGFHKTDVMGIPLLKKGRKKYFNEFPLNKSLIRKAFKLSKLLTFNSFASGRLGRLAEESEPARGGQLLTNIETGAFVTVSTVTGTDKRAKELEKRFNAICENMEGAAVAHVCAMYGIPMLEIRGISNIVEDRNRDKWDIKTAAENCQRAVLAFIREGKA